VAQGFGPGQRGSRGYTHPVVGEITLDWDAPTSDAEPAEQLVIYVAEPDSAIRGCASRARGVGRAAFRPDAERREFVQIHPVSDLARQAR
jgi:hypothetical protein